MQCTTCTRTAIVLLSAQFCASAAMKAVDHVFWPLWRSEFYLILCYESFGGVYLLCLESTFPSLCTDLGAGIHRIEPSSMSDGGSGSLSFFNPHIGIPVYTIAHYLFHLYMVHYIFHPPPKNFELENGTLK